MQLASHDALHFFLFSFSVVACSQAMISLRISLGVDVGVILAYKRGGGGIQIEMDSHDMVSRHPHHRPSLRRKECQLM